MKLVTVTGMIVIGFLLLVLSSMWTSLSRAEKTWTEEKDQRSVEVKARLAYLGGQINRPRASVHSGPDPATVKAEFDALQKENEQLNAEFQSVSTRPNTTARYLKWSGITLAIVGLLGWYAVKQNS
jgi:hypothetical protein